MEEGFLKILWHESCAIDGFCVRLRCDLIWDKEAFDRLTEAMRRCCKFYEVVSTQQEKQWYAQARQTPQEYVAKQKKKAENEMGDPFDDLRDPPLPETTRIFPDWLVLPHL